MSTQSANVVTTIGLRKVLEEAKQIARDRGDYWVGQNHVLLAIARHQEAHWCGHGVLQKLGITSESIAESIGEAF